MGPPGNWSPRPPRAGDACSSPTVESGEPWSAGFTGRGARLAELEGSRRPAVSVAGLGTSWLFRLFNLHKCLQSVDHDLHFTNGKTGA